MEEILWIHERRHFFEIKKLIKWHTLHTQKKWREWCLIDGFHIKHGAYNEDELKSRRQLSIKRFPVNLEGIIYEYANAMTMTKLHRFWIFAEGVFIHDAIPELWSPETHCVTNPHHTRIVPENAIVPHWSCVNAASNYSLIHSRPDQNQLAVSRSLSSRSRRKLEGIRRGRCW